MNKEYVENNLDKISIYSPNNFIDITQLIDRIFSIVNQQLDDAQQFKYIFNKNPSQSTIYQILCEIKNKTNLKNYEFININERKSDELIRVDNMLSAEGIIGQLSTNLFEQSEYQIKLAQIRQIYNSEFEKYEKHCKDFCSHVVTLLREQSQIRPISEYEIQRMISIIQKKFSIIQLQLKQSTCEAIIILRSKSLDTRRKRRNFSKLTIEALDEYFYSNLSNPYPSEEIKEQLAQQCGISVAQVNNWFGNKRIRYKKNINKIQEQTHIKVNQQRRSHNL